MRGFEKLGFNIVISSSVNIKNSSTYTIEEQINTKNKNKLVSMLVKIIAYYKLLKKYKPYFIYVSVPWWSNFLIFIPAKILNKNCSKNF